MYFQRGQDGRICGVSVDHQTNWESAQSVCRSFSDAEALAAELNQEFGPDTPQGNLYLPVDRGGSTWPRYTVMRAPKVGDPISYGFNGDYYPDGEITKVGGTDCSRVYSSTGSVYNRRRKSGAWIKRGGTWSMVQGHVDERNPSF